VVTKIALTDRYIKGVQAAEQRLEVTDLTCRGLTFRVTTKGVKSFSLVAKIEGKFHRITLGQYPVMSLAQARARADEARKALSEGRGTNAQPAEAGAPKTFEALTVEYLENAKGKKSFDHDVNCLKRPRAAFARRDPATLRRKEIEEFIKSLALDYKVMANRTQAAISRVLSFGVEKEYFPANVLAGAKRFGGKEKSRTRTLDASEIKKLWLYLDLDGSPVTPLVGLAIKLVLISAQRPGEISGLSQDELIDLEGPKPIAELPDDRMKTGIAHSWPLTQTALALVKTALAMRRSDAPSRFVFAARRDPESSASQARGDRPISRAALGRALQRFCAQYQMKPFTPHDLRRTANSIASAEKIPLEYSDRLLSHRLPGQQKTYNRHAFADEKRACAEAIERHILRLIADTPARSA
jgi:integrase